MEIDPDQRLQVLKSLKEAQEERGKMSPKELANLRREHYKAMTSVDWDLAARQGRLEACLQGAILTRKSLRKGGVSLSLDDLSIFLCLTNDQWNQIHGKAFEELKGKPKKSRSDFKLFVREVHLARELHENHQLPLRYRLSAQLQLNLESLN